ncbi:MAG: hypothetical protein ABIN94_04590 [Ferruginibacter sp.]
MKKIVIGLFAFAACVFTANAQETGKTHHKSNHGKHMMLKELNLTAAQKDQLKASRQNTHQQLADLNKNENITVKEYKTRKASILKAQKDAMEKVLTPAQKDQVMQAKQKAEVRHEAMNAKRLEKMKAKLNLSDEQVATIKSNREAGKAKVKAIRENTQLTAAEKKDQLMAIRKAQKDSFKQVLTPEQINKMEDLRKERLDKKASK